MDGAPDRRWPIKRRQRQQTLHSAAYRNWLRRYGSGHHVVVLMSEVSLLRSTLASDEHPNALDHLGGRACSLGQEDVGTGRAIEGVDRAGDDHRGQTRLQLFSAADKLVAVHLGHDEVTEKKIEGTGEGLLDNFKRLLRGERCNDAIASGFEEKSPD